MAKMTKQLLEFHINGMSAKNIGANAREWRVWIRASVSNTINFN